MIALVTGGGGFLGKALVQKLLERGDTVRSISRSKYPELEALGVICIQGDLQDISAVEKAVDGVDVVFHSAANHAMWASFDELYGPNVTGTENIINACKKFHVQKLVYTSTPSVVFSMDDMKNADESTPYPDHYAANYPKTKAIAEKLLLEANCSELYTCALRPHLIWGVGDPHIVPMLAERAKGGQLTQVGDGKNSVDFCYIDNAVHAHILAAEHLIEGSPVCGSAYFITDDNPTNLWNWIHDLLKRLDLPAPKKQISIGKALAIGQLMEFIYTVLPLKGSPRITRFMASNFACSHYFNIDKAKADLS
ncbi:MAG: NAD-dependent epimerase/dehydratase family protein [Lentisphaeria bacterium]|nr:NAD-dependent epimerase/dehydratase family protein [Lentisphaeria bacterium]